ncbi:MAG TPA: PA14 domain-containing protein, partial [bacterium]|nr:PA14 domain-containing protein [bacterium]
MKRFLSCLFLSLLALTAPAFAQFNGDGLKGIYYITPNLTSPAVTEVDPLVSYRWFGCPPQPGMSGTSFSVRWTGQVKPAYSEPYTIYADVNGGVSLIVNGQVLASHWTDTGPPVTRYQGAITLSAGTPYSIEVDYFTNGANPSSDLIQLGWESPSQVTGYIPHQYLFSGAALNPTPTPQTPSSCQSYASGIMVNGVLSEWPWSTGGWNTVNRTVLGN